MYHRGIVKVKVGPITAQYKGEAKLVEADVEAHRALLEANGRDTRGAGNAAAPPSGPSSCRRATTPTSAWSPTSR